jgi:(p)ppGpp synthase/HD superfamily hydrolase
MTPPWSPERYLDAQQFAAEAHRGQQMPGSDGLPYLMHVDMVCMETLGALSVETYDDPDLAMQCALLHDTIEDTAATYDAVAARFGAAVADGVRALSKDADVPPERRMADSLARIRAQPREVWIVKLADRICNLREPPHYWTRDKRAAYRREAETILAALGPASAYLAGRLRDKIGAYGAFIAP